MVKDYDTERASRRRKRLSYGAMGFFAAGAIMGLVGFTYPKINPPTQSPVLERYERTSNSNLERSAQEQQINERVSFYSVVGGAGALLSGLLLSILSTKRRREYREKEGEDEQEPHGLV